MTPPRDPRLAAAIARWSEAWRARWQERAAIYEHDALLPRDVAEERAAMAVGMERVLAKGERR